jgi:GR25 family glycosyltransferase involved in LPS biosynthesis
MTLETKIGALDLLIGSTVDEKVLENQRDAIKKENAALQKERKKIKDLSAEVDHYEVHLKQKEMNRKKVQEIQHHLKPNECLVFRDFVNSYNARGKKVLNMVLVVLYVLKEGQDPPCVTVVHNVSDFDFDPNNKADRYFAMDVLDFHLNPENGSMLFLRFTIIYLSGDHGSHFSAREILFFESLIWERYKKTLREVSLASYHCYNRCDAGGASLVTLVKCQAKKGADLWGARQYVDCIRKFGAENAVGYAFTRINRSQWLTAGYLPKGKAKRTTGGLIEEFNDEWCFPLEIVYIPNPAGV